MSVASVQNDPFAYLDQAYQGANNEVRYTSVEKTTAEAPSDAAAGTEEETTALFGEDGFGFDDFLDIINPLQHIPVISNLYREFTGDELSPGARMIGGGIFGGGVGLASSVINSAIEMQTGKDIGGHVIGLFTSDDETAPAPQAVADVTGQPSTAATDRQAPSPLLQAASLAAVNTAPVGAPGPASKALPVNEEVRPSTPTDASNVPEPKLFMGLEWKGGAPNIGDNIKQLETLQKKNLSESQMNEIFKAFGSAAPVQPETEVKPVSLTTKPADPLASKQEPSAQPHTNLYTPPVDAAVRTPVDLGQSFQYLDTAV
ncbi:hypothetical protein [Sneathiella aquimaris]|uniref:hypothetical protein n=1 Tax=Sneathiella aquimaris TaxID=2599305 RepID=UPI00146E4420|nr:hypothetical protein [Sneathiella aquimaris]